MALIPNYTFSSYAFSGAALTEGYALNDRGQLVGAYEVSGRDHGFVESGGALTSIDYPSATDTYAFGINNAGMIVGYFDGASSSSGPGAAGFTLSGGQYSVIAVPAAVRTEARGINDAGTIVGDYETGASSLTSGFIDRGGSFTTFAVPGATSTIPYRINSSGSQVVGFYQNANDDDVHGFSYDVASNAFTFIDHPGATSTDVFGLNDAGVLSGDYMDATGSHAFTDDGGVFSDVDNPNSASSLIFGINNAGQLAGFESIGSDIDAFIATPNPTTPCYCAGTRIRVWRAGAEIDVHVQSLVIGDLVVTGSGAHRPVRWLGRRSYVGRFANRNPDVLPVCFQAGSLADGVPMRDLWVSPKHAMFVDGVLVPAECLVNGVSVIKAIRVDRVDYHHVELDSHDVLLAEGAPSESFVDDEGRQIFHNAQEHAALYPDAVRMEAIYCAPRLEEGAALEAIRRGIEARWMASRPNQKNLIIPDEGRARLAP